MNERIIYTRQPAEFLRKMECTVLELFHFGDIAGGAACVECEKQHESTIAEDDRVHAIEPIITITTTFEPEFIDQQPDQIATIEDVRQLHDIPTDDATGEGYTAVAMDSGVDPSHPVFKDKSIQQVDVTRSGEGDTVGHGTAVMGQIVRLAPDADLIALRIFGSKGQTDNRTIMRAYEWLHNNTDSYDVVNMSWGSQRRSEQIDRIHNRLVEKGIRDVVAAGNTGEKAGSPGTAERAFSVAACTEEGAIAEFSSYNPKRDNPDVTAIGKNNRLAQASGTAMGQELEGPWVKGSGTSFSSPETTGMALKYLSVHEAKPETIMVDFEATARDIEDQPRDGAGIADYKTAVNRSQ